MRNHKKTQNAGICISSDNIFRHYCACTVEITTKSFVMF